MSSSIKPQSSCPLTDLCGIQDISQIFCVLVLFNISLCHSLDTCSPAANGFYAASKPTLARRRGTRRYAQCPPREWSTAGTRSQRVCSEWGRSCGGSFLCACQDDSQGVLQVTRGIVYSLCMEQQHILPRSCDVSFPPGGSSRCTV